MLVLARPLYAVIVVAESTWYLLNGCCTLAWALSGAGGFLDSGFSIAVAQ